MSEDNTPPFSQSYVEAERGFWDQPRTSNLALQQHGTQLKSRDTDVRRQSGIMNADYGPTPASTPDPTRAHVSRQWHWIKDSHWVMKESPLGYSKGHPGYLKMDADHVRDDLSQQRINDIHIHLWWVGRQGNIRPLHHQKAMFRDIVVTERPYLHMVWFENNIFLKPLPEYLLDRTFFEKIICDNKGKCPTAGLNKCTHEFKCVDQDLYRLACGFLYSYSKLIVHRSDHKIAIEEGLLPDYMDWVKWCEFANEIRDSVDFRKINRRYRYGELRLTRLNHIYRFCRGEVRGFYSLDRGYNSFFRRNFGWLVGLFAFLTIILTGMQVVLATDSGKAAGQGLFEEVSYVFGVVSIVIPVVGTAAGLALFFVLFWWNVVHTLVHRVKIQTQRKAKENDLEKARG